MREKDIFEELKTDFKDNFSDIKEKYYKALDLAQDMRDERDQQKEEKQEIINRLEWVLGSDLNEMENTIHGIISEFKEKF